MRRMIRLESNMVERRVEMITTILCPTHKEVEVGTLGRVDTAFMKHLSSAIKTHLMMKE